METEPKVPRYLYRAWSNDTHGLNLRTRFAPQITRVKDPPPTYELHGLRFVAKKNPEWPDNQLAKALRKEMDREFNPFVFFTCSFPQVLVHASYKEKKNGEKNIKVTCIDTNTAGNDRRQRVKFFRVREIMRIMRIPLEAGHTREPLDFEDVWVTSDIVILGLGSSIAPWSILINARLARCVPEFDVIRESTAGVAAPIRNLREYWFGKGFEKVVDLLEEEFNFCARLAALFEPVFLQESNDNLPMHIFAWFLTMKEQDAGGRRLRKWLARYGAVLPRASEGVLVVKQDNAYGLCEVKRFMEINKVVGRYKVGTNKINRLDAEISMWKVWARREHFMSKRAAINVVRHLRWLRWIGKIDRFGNEILAKAKNGELLTNTSRAILTSTAVITDTREWWKIKLEKEKEQRALKAKEEKARLRRAKKRKRSKASKVPQSESTEEASSVTSMAPESESTEVVPSQSSKLDAHMKDTDDALDMQEISADFKMTDACEAGELDIDEGVGDV